LSRQGFKERRVSAKTTNWDTARTLAAEWSRKLNAPLRQHSGLTCLDVLDKHLAWREAGPKSNPATTSNYRRAHHFLGKALAGTFAEKLTEAKILLARDHLVQREDLAPSTINLYMRCGKTAWDWARKRGIVVAPWLPPAPLEEEDSLKRPLTPAELADFRGWLRSYCGGRWVLFFNVLIESGCRVSEVRLLREGDLDRETGSILIRSHRSRGSSKKNKAIGVTKLTASLVPLRKHGELLFPGFGKANAPVSREQPRKILKLWAEQALADPENIDSHSLRRSWISHARRAGVSDAVGQRQAGISSIRVYTGYERNTVGDDLHRAVEQVQEYRRRATPAVPFMGEAS